MSREDYEDMLARQAGRCAVCREEHGRELRVDHDHETGKVRELLCANCNSAIGLLKEEPKRMKRARKYVMRHKGL